jgi:type II secretory pathway component PulK
MTTSSRGFALVWALLLTVVASTACAALVVDVRTAHMTSATAVQSAQAFFAAEGGLAHARHRLARDAAYAGETLRIGPCTVRVGVRKQSPGWEVEAEAEPGGALVRCALVPGGGLPAVERWQRVR